MKDRLRGVSMKIIKSESVLIWFLPMACSISVPAFAQEEMIPLEECVVLQKHERKSTCLGTGLNNDPARDPQLYFYNQCTKKIGVKQCFVFPNDKVAYSTETIKPGETERLYKCTESTNPGVLGAKRMEPKPTGYFVWDPESGSSYQYQCE